MNALAARLVVGLAGPQLHPRERDWLAHWRPAGVILFARNCLDAAGCRRLIAELHAVLPAGAEICADHEGGAVSFLQAAAGRPPAPRLLGDLDHPDLTRRVHEETGRRLRDLGLDRVLAPCCDVLDEPRNPVIGARAFAATVDRTTRHAAAAMAGLAAAGLRGCPKHWPGHGATARDTHDHAAAAACQDRDAPFRAALAAGADAVMAGHLPVAAERPPLTVDAAGLAGLRRDLGPDIRIWSDDVSMGALRAPLAERGIGAGDGRTEGLADPAILTARWLEATGGCDRVLLRGIPWRALPLPDGDGPRLPADPPTLDLAACGPAAASYDEARRLAAASIRLRPGPDRVLWLDATSGDRLGEAAGLAAQLHAWWPRLERLDPRTPRLAPGDPYAALLVTSHRPLTVALAQLLEPLTAALGTALAAGHPSLAGDLARLLGPGWQIDALADCSAADFAPLAP